MELLARIYKVALFVARGSFFVHRFVVLLGFILVYFCEGFINKLCMCLSQLIS